MLSDWSLERAGRVAQEKKKSVPVSELSSSQQCDVATTAAAKEEESKEIQPPGPSPPSLSDRKVQTTAMIIIGDEILNGFTTDLNLQVATKALSSIGVPLKKVEAFPYRTSLLIIDPYNCMCV